MNAVRMAVIFRGRVRGFTLNFNFGKNRALIQLAGRVGPSPDLNTKGLPCGVSALYPSLCPLPQPLLEKSGRTIKQSRLKV